MILDSDGNELVYWPISGLIEGQDSETLEFTVPVPVTGGELSASADPRLIVWAREAGDVTWVNVSENPIDLTALAGTDVDFECYVEALSPIEGLERVPVSVNAGTGSPAGWTS